MLFVSMIFVFSMFQKAVRIDNKIKRLYTLSQEIRASSGILFKDAFSDSQTKEGK